MILVQDKSLWSSSDNSLNFIMNCKKNYLAIKIHIFKPVFHAAQCFLMKSSCKIKIEIYVCIYIAIYVSHKLLPLFIKDDFSATEETKLF